MAAVVPASWTEYFTNLSSFLLTCERRYGLANEQFTEYALERLSQSYQSLQNIVEVVEEANGLNRLREDLLELSQCVVLSWQKWTDHSDALDTRRLVTQYVPPVIRHAGRGRPKFHVTKEQLQYLRSLSFSWTAIAKMLSISRMTLYRRRVEYEMLDDQQSSISNQQLVESVQQILTEHPHVGQSFILGRLRSLGYRVCRERVRQAIRFLDPLSILRWHGIVTRRRPYSVPGPNSLWHVDGHHKLIRWNIVTHGGIDGFSRMIVYLKCSGNNRSSTVYSLFVDAVQRFGLPSRVRSDLGGENYMIARHMLQYRGVGRGSMLTGSSTHNQRIERLWVDMHRSVTRMYYDLFYFLEQHGMLDPLNQEHLFALHYIYIPRINKSLKAFQNGWNHHGIRTAGHLSPEQQFASGALRLRLSGLAALDFFENVDERYGRSYDDPVPAVEVTAVTVPEVRFTLPNSELERLSALINPLQESNNYGIELYFSVLDHLHTLNT